MTDHLLSPGFSRAFVCALVCVGVAAGAGTAAAAPTNGLSFFADLGGKPGTYEVMQVRSTTGTLRWLSFRAVRDVRVNVTRRMEGRVVGAISVDGTKTKLVMPRGASRLVGSRRSAVLASSTASGRELRVVLHLATPFNGVGGPVVLSVNKLPRGAANVGISFDGEGRGILGPPHGCPVSPTLRLYAVRDGAAPAYIDSGVRC